MIPADKVMASENKHFLSYYSIPAESQLEDSLTGHELKSQKVICAKFRPIAID